MRFGSFERSVLLPAEVKSDKAKTEQYENLVQTPKLCQGFP